MTDGPLSVLIVTSEWPSPGFPQSGTFVVQQVEFLRRTGAHVEILAFSGRRRPIYYLRTYQAIRRATAIGKYDIVHAQFGHSGALAVTGKRTPVVVTFHGSDLEGIIGPRGRYTASGILFRLVSRYAARRADATIVVGSRLGRRLATHPTAVIAGGVDLDRFKPESKSRACAALGWEPGVKRVLFIADPKVRSKRFWLARAAVDLVEEAQLVVLWGIDPMDMPTYMNAADALVLVSAHGGSPTVVKEALACDLRVVAVDIGDVSERIGDVDGCAVSFDDRPESIAAALRSVLAHEGPFDGRRAVVDLAAEMQAAKILDVYDQVLHPNRGSSGRMPTDAVRVGLPRVLMVTSEWPTLDVPYRGCFVAQQVAFLRAAGVRVDVLNFQGRRSPVEYFRIWKRIRRAISSGRYGLVHAQFGHSGALSLLPKSLPVVITFRGSDLEGIVGPGGRYLLSGRVFRVVSQLSARRADATIAVSRRLGRRLPSPPTAVIPSGLDLDLFQGMPQAAARELLGIEPGHPVVLFVGDPENETKRLWLAKRAVEMIPGAELLVGWAIDRKDVPTYMSAADALVIVSMHEGSPNVVKEALACDLPVVGVDVGDVRERIEPVAGCIVCEDDRPETIAEALRQVLQRRERVDGRVAVRELDERVLVQKVIDVYRGVLEPR